MASTAQLTKDMEDVRLISSKDVIFTVSLVCSRATLRVTQWAEYPCVECEACEVSKLQVQKVVHSLSKGGMHANLMNNIVRVSVFMPVVFLKDCRQVGLMREVESVLSCPRTHQIREDVVMCREQIKQPLAVGRPRSATDTESLGVEGNS